MASNYDGSEILLPLSKACGIPIDQVNFIVVEIVALLFGVVFRKLLGPELVSSTTRHAVSLILGVAFGLFCFGNKLFHIVAQTGLCYMCLKLLPASITHLVVFVFAIGYLVVIHIHRTYFDEPGYCMDISGPLMITTQKVTNLAFSISDGCHRESEKLTVFQKNKAVKYYPSLLEFSSYIFYFQGLLVGPPSFFSDYKAFIEGTDLVKQVPSTALTQGKPQSFYVHKPSPLEPVMKKLVTAMIWLMIHLFLASQNPSSRNSGDAVHNASGFGWDGVDKFGHHKWDLVTNIKITNIETGQSLKEFTDNWNTQTSLWLRHVCYDRIPRQKVLATFTLSAVWHGFYSGYYFTFICSGLFLSAGRQVRRKVRPYFLNSTKLKAFYDVCTWLGTHLVISYVGVAFNELYLQPILIFYGSLYFFLHVLSIVILVIMPFVPTPEAKMSAQEISSRSSLKSLNNNEMVSGKQTKGMQSSYLSKKQD